MESLLLPLQVLRRATSRKLRNLLTILVGNSTVIIAVFIFSVLHGFIMDTLKFPVSSFLFSLDTNC